MHPASDGVESNWQTVLSLSCRELPGWRRRGYMPRRRRGRMMEKGSMMLHRRRLPVRQTIRTSNSRSRWLQVIENSTSGGERSERLIIVEDPWPRIDSPKRQLNLRTAIREKRQTKKYGVVGLQLRLKILDEAASVQETILCRWIRRSIEPPKRRWVQDLDLVHVAWTRLEDDS